MTIEASPTTRFQEFTENNASWVRGCQEERVYLKGDRLTIENDLIYVVDDTNEKMPLPELFCDSQGVYIKVASQERSKDNGVYNILWCNRCGELTYHDWFGRCGKCGKRKGD